MQILNELEKTNCLYFWSDFSFSSESRLVWASEDRGRKRAGLGSAIGRASIENDGAEDELLLASC